MSNTTRLRAWRLLHGWKLQDLADAVDLSPAYLAMIEKGAVPSGEIAERFQRVFGEPLESLLSPADVRKLPSLQRDKVPA